MVCSMKAKAVQPSHTLAASPAARTKGRNKVSVLVGSVSAWLQQKNPLRMRMRSTEQTDFDGRWWLAAIESSGWLYVTIAPTLTA